MTAGYINTQHESYSSSVSVSLSTPEDRLAFAEELGSMRESDFMVEEAEPMEVRAVPSELEEIVENQDFLQAQ